MKKVAEEAFFVGVRTLWGEILHSENADIKISVGNGRRTEYYMRRTSHPKKMECINILQFPWKKHLAEAGFTCGDTCIVSLVEVSNVVDTQNSSAAIMVTSFDQLQAYVLIDNSQQFIELYEKLREDMRTQVVV
jgi:hypothetical protein